ncbi:MAG: right-handed parallel beta-helix repeat-containing protein [Clostridia bacterium]|nr:right-handed parallel beta-helix repeat-containing protein [Clostridia bacterium]
MTINFNDFRASHNDTLDLINALEHCKRVGATGLTFENGVYELCDRDAKEVIIDVSNHGDTNRRKSAFLLQNFENFTIDGGNSTFIFKGIMNAFTLIGCRNVTLKNCTIEFPDYPYPNGFVTEVTDDFFDLRFDSDNVLTKDGILYVKSGEFCDKVHCDVRFDAKTHEIVRNTGDNSLGININKLNCKQLENGCFRFFNPPVFPSKAHVFGLLTGIRRASGILLDNSADTVIQNVTIHSCIGIGIIAQCCHNVTVDGCRVTAGQGRYVSSAADATHFVACTGLVEVKNSLFEHMLDDALNVHGIYTKVVEAECGRAVVKFMNSASKGIEIYKKGDALAALDPETLKPFDPLTVKSAVLIDREHTALEFEEGKTLPLDCIVENLTRYPELKFENNTVQNNRARGMLIATNRKAVVKNCRFHTSGSAIVLECDGKFWFESGAVHDLTIENNVFCDCRYANWDKGVISIPEGKQRVDGFYYHGKIEIKNNAFTGFNDYDIYADNVSELIYVGNHSENRHVKLWHIGSFKSD